MTDPGRKEQASPITLRVDWSEVTAAPVHHVNQVMGQIGPANSGVPDGIYLTFASVFPPPITSAEDQARLVEDLKGAGLQAVPAGRFHMSRELAQEAINVLRFSIAQYDASIQQALQQKAAGEELRDDL